VNRDLVNAVVVQAFRRLPWLGRLWARRRRFVEGETIPWAPLTQPIAASTVALVTTAGVHLVGDAPFDMRDPDGDPSVRVIPSDTPRERITITHKYYDHTAADRDLNVVLPIDRLRELRDERRVGAIAPMIYGFMGHVDGRHIETLIAETAPDVARRLVRDGAQAVVLTPA
jgi:D-proline reductase (dithiol) PrdB